MRLLLFLLGPLLIVTMAGAQEPPSSSPASGTGSVAAQRAERAATLRDILGTIAKRDAQWQTVRSAYVRDRMEQQRACREDLRRANRDAKVPTLVRCYRGSLTLEREFLRREKDYVRSLVEATEPRRNDVLVRSDQLTEAIGTLVFAFDSGVYDRQEDVLQARQRLQEKYRSPLSDARTLLRGDRLLSWYALLLDEITDPPACLPEGEATLRASLATDNADVAGLLATLQALPSCLDTAGTASSVPAS
ncbi:MAG: hypothetical protein PHW10_03735 [Candidatus Peribacteraceae bacterium]|nr:hypothetical protein [Candidatus Peribacteraceae bacterium]